MRVHLSASLRTSGKSKDETTREKPGKVKLCSRAWRTWGATGTDLKPWSEEKLTTFNRYIWASSKRSISRNRCRTYNRKWADRNKETPNWRDIGLNLEPIDLRNMTNQQWTWWFLTINTLQLPNCWNAEEKKLVHENRKRLLRSASKANLTRCSRAPVPPPARTLLAPGQRWDSSRRIRWANWKCTTLINQQTAPPTNLFLPCVLTMQLT